MTEQEHWIEDSVIQIFIPTSYTSTQWSLINGLLWIAQSKHCSHQNLDFILYNQMQWSKEHVCHARENKYVHLLCKYIWLFKLQPSRFSWFSTGTENMGLMQTYLNTVGFLHRIVLYMHYWYTTAPSHVRWKTSIWTMLSCFCKSIMPGWQLMTSSTSKLFCLQTFTKTTIKAGLWKECIILLQTPKWSLLGCLRVEFHMPKKIQK